MSFHKAETPCQTVLKGVLRNAASKGAEGKKTHSWVDSKTNLSLNIDTANETYLNKGFLPLF